MKKFHLIYAAFIIGNAIFWSGCSKNDNDSSDPNPKQEITMPKEAFQLQIVEAQFSQPLLQEEYDADLGGIPLKLVRSDDNTLVFYVPGTTAVGETTLNIPQLEAQSKFEVKKSVLNGNEEVVLKPFFEDLNFSQNRISDEEYSEYLADALTAFEAYYKSLSKDDKNQMALFYQVNENWFKEILGLSSTPKFTTLGAASTFNSVKKYQLTVLTFVTSGLIAVYGATPLEKSVAAVACLASGAFAWQYQKELVGEIKIVDQIVDKIMDPVFGNQITKSALETQGLVFTNDEAQNVNLYTGNRNVTTADELSTAEGTSIYFDAYGRLINITEKVNDVIQFINDNLFFSNISQIPVHKIPGSAEMQSSVLTAEDYNSLKFTVAEDNVQLSDVAFENGVIRMKMTVKNPDTVTGNSLKTTLNYSYQNEFSNATGSIPIEVKLEEEQDLPELTGVWILKWYYIDANNEHYQDDWIDFKNGASDIAIKLKSQNYSGEGWVDNNPDSNDSYNQYTQSTYKSGTTYIISVKNVGRSNVILKFNYNPATDNFYHLKGNPEGAAASTYNLELVKE
jgi:hypothetical protein